MKILKSCFKFVFLNKKLKENNQCYILDFLKNAMIKNTNIYIYIDHKFLKKKQEHNMCKTRIQQDFIARTKQE